MVRTLAGHHASPTQKLRPELWYVLELLKDLIQHLDREDEANARKRERSKKKKDRKSRSSDSEEVQPTVGLREHKPPSEDDEGVVRL